MKSVLLTNRITVTKQDGTQCCINAHVEIANGYHLVTCSKQHEALVRGAKSITWKPRTSAARPESVELSVTSSADCSIDYIRFKCVAITALFPHAILAAVDDPSVSITLLDYSLKFDSLASHAEFIGGAVDFENQHKRERILLSGAGDAVNKLRDCQHKIFTLQIGLSASYKCILVRLDTESALMQNKWSVTLETIPTDPTE